MDIVSKIDEYGKPAWIVALVLGFIVFWPIGLGVLGYLIWSGRMRCWTGSGKGRWHNSERNNFTGNPGDSNSGPGKNGQVSGNWAFDEYRAETLDRLEDEQNEFVTYLDKLRQAKDKAEFEQFMSERKKNPVSAQTDDVDDIEDVQDAEGEGSSGGEIISPTRSVPAARPKKN